MRSPLWHHVVALLFRSMSSFERGRPHDILSCLFFTALWLQQSQFILTQVQQTNDIDLTCYKTLPTKSATCLQVGPMSLEWLVALPAGSDQSSVSLSHEDPNDRHPGDALPTHQHLRWRRNALQPPQKPQGSRDRNKCVHIPDGGLRCVTWNIERSYWVGFFLTNLQGAKTWSYWIYEFLATFQGTDTSLFQST